MKKLFCLILAAVLLLACVPAALAVDNSRQFQFELAVDGKDSKEVQTGDIITVVFTLKRTDSDEDYDMYAMQNEIRYNSEFFKLVEGTAMLSDGISTTEIALRDNFREYYMNFVSLSGGEKWKANRLVGSFQLEVIGTSGVSKITNEDCLVSTADGNDVFEATCQDVTIILSTECTVTFKTNGGTEISPVTAQYGEKLVRPEDPIREGYHVVAWCRDIDLQQPWDFETDVVQGNMTLYAKWEEGNPAGAGSGAWVLILILLLIVLAGAGVVLLLFLGRKTIVFESNCDTTVPTQKVRKGGFVQRPEEPKREGRIFAGWYQDEACTQRWDFEYGTVNDNMTLYAKWI